MSDDTTDVLTSLSDFDDKPLVELTEVSTPPPELPASVVDDDWDTELALPITDAAPEPIRIPSSEIVPRFLYDQPIESGVTRYEVQRGFTVEERVYKPGDVIPVQCRFCVLWNREWMGKIRCYPGRTLGNGNIMSVDKFSCERYFVCKEMESEFKTLLAFSRPTVMMLKHQISTFKKVLEVEKWARRNLRGFEEHNPTEVFKIALEYLSAFTSLPQLVLIESFVKEYHQVLVDRDNKNRRKVGRPRLPHGPGDLVAWVEPEMNSVLKGVIVKRARGVLIIACIDGPEQLLGQKMKYNYKDWREQKNPTILRKSADSVVEAQS